MQVNRSQIASSHYAGTTPQSLVQQLVSLNEGDERAALDMFERTPRGVRARGRFGNGLLHAAAELNSSARVIHALVRVGCNPLATKRRGESDLHVAASRGDGDPEVVSALLTAGGLPLADLSDRQHVAARIAAAAFVCALLTTQSRKAWHDADLSAALLIALRENTPRVAVAVLEYAGTLDTRTMRDALPHRRSPPSRPALGRGEPSRRQPQAGLIAARAAGCNGDCSKGACQMINVSRPIALPGMPLTKGSADEAIIPAEHLVHHEGL